MQPCRPMRMWSAPLAFENSRSECVISKVCLVARRWRDDGERDPQRAHRSCAPKKTDLAAGVLERSGGRFAMKTVASTLGVARSNLIERRDKVIQARGPYRKAEDA